MDWVWDGLEYFFVYNNSQWSNGLFFSIKYREKRMKCNTCKPRNNIRIWEKLN